MDTIYTPIEFFGIQHQRQKAVEEMAELIVALAHEDEGRATKQEVITEIADVYYLTEQLMHIYGIDECKAEVARKKDRTLERIKNQMSNKE